MYGNEHSVISIYCANVWQRTFRNIHLLRKCIAANIPQGVGADSSRPFYNPNQMVLIWRNDMNCNTILCNYVGTVQCIAISTMGIHNAILWVFVGTGTINRPLRLRNGRGKTWGTINKITALQYQWWKIATPFCGISWARAR